MVKICCATTDNTSRSIRLNSSKQDHAPHEARPYININEDDVNIDQYIKLTMNEILFNFCISYRKQMKILN